MAPVDKLLGRLERVKQTAPDRWIASCPAHDDRSPSLSVRELGDGRLLIHDFGGCGAADIVEALGLTMADLFPEGCRGELRAVASRIPARDLLDILSEETSVVSIVVADLLERRTVSEADWQRLAAAAHRIHHVRDYACGR